MKNDPPPNFNHEWDNIRIRPAGSRNSYTLCSSCRHAAGCTFQKDPQIPSFYCEEFEIDPGLLAEKAELKKSVSAASPKTEADSGEFIGLCSNCDHRNTCNFEKPEGGIWHCEEYQ